MTDKQIIIDGEHDMNYCEDNNCKHYGNKEQCEKTHCYYRCYSKLYKQLKRKEQECEELKKANEEKNELLIKLGCPTTATAKRKVLYLEKELEKIKEINNEIKTDLKNWDERFKLQNAFIDNLLKATNNSIWIDKSISDEEASEIIEKIEMDYIEFEEGKEIYAELKAENEKLKKQLQKYKDNEQQEKEMQKLYYKFNGNILIEKRTPNEQI